MLCAEMYLPKDFNEAQHYAALIIGHPFGAVKEQCSGLYAQEMARRGYVTLALMLPIKAKVEENRVTRYRPTHWWKTSVLL